VIEILPFNSVVPAEGRSAVDAGKLQKATSRLLGDLEGGGSYRDGGGSEVAVPQVKQTHEAVKPQPLPRP